MSTSCEKTNEQIEQVKKQLQNLGPMRPGSVSRQYRDPQEKKRPFYQLSYTHKMKSRSEYVRPENLAAVRRETASYKRFRKLTERWVELSLKLSQLKTLQGKHSESL